MLLVLDDKIFIIPTKYKKIDTYTKCLKNSTNLFLKNFKSFNYLTTHYFKVNNVFFCTFMYYF